MKNFAKYTSSVTCAALFLGGCSSSLPAHEDSVTTYAEYSPVEPGVGDSAELRGTVHITSGCVRVIAAEDDVTYTPIFPDPSTLADGLADGDHVSLRGGAADVLPSGVTANGCDAAPFWIVVEDQ